jgi:hypothetical protein
MAEARQIPDEAETRALWGAFAYWAPERQQATDIMFGECDR